MEFETRAIHAGQEPDPTTGALTVPIHQTSTYLQSAVGENKGYDYSRASNPTRSALETCLASLEGAEHGVAFASGWPEKGSTCGATSSQARADDAVSAFQWIGTNSAPRCWPSLRCTL